MLIFSTSNWIDLGAAIATMFGVGVALYTNHQSLKTSQKLTLLQDRSRLFLEAEEFRQAIEDEEDFHGCHGIYRDSDCSSIETPNGF